MGVVQQELALLETGDCPVEFVDVGVAPWTGTQGLTPPFAAGICVGRMVVGGLRVGGATVDGTCDIVGNRTRFCPLATAGISPRQVTASNQRNGVCVRCTRILTIIERFAAR